LIEVNVLRTVFGVVLALTLAAPTFAHHGVDHEASTPALFEKLRSFLDDALSPDEEEILDPELAFRLTATITDANTLAAHWEIADGYYLYRDKFRFTVKDPPGIDANSINMPEGKVKTDEFFGRTEVYYGQAQATVGLTRATPDPVSINVDIGYQGCADLGVCYPPMTKTVALSLPAEPTGSAAADATILNAPEDRSPSESAGEGFLSVEDRIARSLTTANLWLVLLSFFGFGLLLTFTPCVFPMIPILSSIIIGQGDRVTTLHAFTLSLTYVLAVSATYTAAGVTAGLFGANLQVLFQNPWALGGFAGVFVLLAMSMFGFYDLQIPAAWQIRLARLSNRQQGGTYLGVGIMGIFSALIVGPCVAAPLAGALIYIGQTGDAVLGGLALFALSMGMGTPVLAFGTSAGRLFPKAGSWMATVKAVFGVLLIGVAIYLLERILPEWITILLWAGLLVVCAIYMGALEVISSGASGWRRLWKGTGLVMLIYGVLLMVGVAAGGGDLFQPLRDLGGNTGARSTQSLSFKPVKGLDGLQVQLRQASSLQKTVMLDFYADWCVSCKEWEKFTFSDAGVQEALADSVLLKADVTANDMLDQELLRSLRLFGPPAILFFGPNGEERRQYRVVGYMDAEQFRSHVGNAFGNRTL
jgi:thiol:disulfide interchange protein DsbD